VCGALWGTMFSARIATASMATTHRMATATAGGILGHEIARFAHLDRCNERSAMSGGPRRVPVPQARIEETIEEIDDQIRCHHRRRDEKQDALHHSKIAVRNGDDKQPP